MCPFRVYNGAFLHDMGEKSTLVDFFSTECRNRSLHYLKIVTTTHQFMHLNVKSFQSIVLHSIIIIFYSRDQKTICRSGHCAGGRGMFCGVCLKNRYGMNIKEALKDANWWCPPCK